MMVQNASALSRLANETIELVRFMSKALPRPFLLPEMVDRMASMINYFFKILTGPKVDFYLLFFCFVFLSYVSMRIGIRVESQTARTISV